MYTCLQYIQLSVTIILGRLFILERMLERLKNAAQVQVETARKCLSSSGTFRSSDNRAKHPQHPKI